MIRFVHAHGAFSDPSPLCPWGDADEAAAGAGADVIHLDVGTLERLLGRSPIGCVVVGRDLGVIWLNHALAEMNAVQREDVAGRSLGDAVPLADASVLRAVEDVLATGEPTPATLLSVTGEEGERQLLCSSFPVAGVGLPDAVVCLMRDVTTLIRSQRLVAGLQQLSSLLSRARTSEDVCAAVLGRAREMFDAQAGAVAQLDATGTVFRLLGHDGYGDLIEWEQFPAGAATPMGDAIRRREAVVLTSRAERIERYPQLRARAEGTTAVVPMLSDDRPAGALAFRFPPGKVLSDDEQSFLATLAEDCAGALERIRLADVERRALERSELLGRLATRLASASTAEEVGEAAIETARRLSDADAALLAWGGDAATATLHEPPDASWPGATGTWACPRSRCCGNCGAGRRSPPTCCCTCCRTTPARSARRT